MITAVSEFYIEKPKIKQFQISKSLKPYGAGEIYILYETRMW